MKHTDADLPPHLKGLNQAQFDAVTSLDGALLVLAGAGSGKTRVLTRRIAHILHNGVGAERILAVTFTNKAASEMKERVKELVGELGGKVWVSTFHSTCGRILRTDIEPLGWSTRFSIYDDDDQIRIVRQIVADLGYDPKEVTPKELLARIDRYKNKGDTLETLRSGHRISPGDALLRVWSAYDEALRAADALDFNDLIGHTLRLFQEHPEVAGKWSERFAYVLVDEYQDTNNTQYQLLRLLTEIHGNLAVVGDDDQSIYGFRGADPQIIQRFKADHPAHKMIAMEQNYRSTGNILQVANFVVEQNTQRERKTLRTDAQSGPQVRLVVEETPIQEAEKVASLISGLHAKKDVPYGKMAIIYRTNATSRLFEMALQARQIPYRVVGGQKFYDRREIRDILAYLHLAMNPANDAAFIRVINVPLRGLGAKTLADLRAEASKRGEPLLASSRASANGDSKKDKAIRSFIEIIDETSDQAAALEPGDLLAWLLERTGYLELVKAEDSQRVEHLMALVADASRAESAAGTFGPLERLQTWLDHTALAGRDEEIPDGGLVALMTVHNAKGLEYPVVFVVQMIEDQFPHAKSQESAAGVEEERRLAYVAFTRAMERLFITRARQKPLGFQELRERGGRGSPPQPAKPSRFIYALPEAACKGDVPQGDQVELEEDPEAGRLRMQTLMRSLLSSNAAPKKAPARRQAPPPPTPEDELPDSYTLVQIESPRQLVVGARVLHPTLGVGRIVAVQGEAYNIRINVAFGRQAPRWLSGTETRLRVIVE